MKSLNLDLLHRDLWISSIFIIFISLASIYFNRIDILIPGVLISFSYWCIRAFLVNGIHFPGGIPNVITLLRFIALLFCAFFHTRFTSLQLGISFALICISDIFDGWLARKLNQSSVLGEYLDKEADASFVLVLSILIYFNIHQALWVLIPGLIRYFYFVVTYFFIKGNEKEHKDPWARIIAVVLFISLISQFILPVTISKPLLVLAVISIIYSFGRSIIYQLNLFSNK